MTNMYLKKDTLQTIHNVAAQDEGCEIVENYKHPFKDNLLFFVKEGKNTVVICLEKRNDSLMSGYVDYLEDSRSPDRYEVPADLPEKYWNLIGDGLHKEGYEFVKRSRRIHSIYMAVLCVLCVNMINAGFFGKKQTHRPKTWKSKRKRYKADYVYDSHWLVEVGKSYTQANPEALSGTIEQRHHMRRGHWRFIPSKGEKVWIKPYWAGNKKLGTITKDYKA